MEQETSPTEEELWIEKPKALQLRAPQEGTTLSPLNPRTRIQTIVVEDLRLGAGDFGIWSRLDDETHILEDTSLSIDQRKKIGLPFKRYPPTEVSTYSYRHMKEHPPYQIQLWRTQNIQNYG